VRTHLKILRNHAALLFSPFVTTINERFLFIKNRETYGGYLPLQWLAFSGKNLKWRLLVQLFDITVVELKVHRRRCHAAVAEDLLEPSDIPVISNAIDGK